MTDLTPQQIYQRAYYQKNKKKLNELAKLRNQKNKYFYTRKYMEEHPDKHRESSLKYVRTKGQPKSIYVAYNDELGVRIEARNLGSIAKVLKTAYLKVKAAYDDGDMIQGYIIDEKDITWEEYDQIKGA